MSLTINHNMMATNTARNLAMHYGNLGTTTRRLSSGLRIGTAADDAAGLAISELGKAKAATLAQAKRNIKDGISLVQVADGALSIVDESLIRLKELAVQSSTGTYNAKQRKIISFEMENLVSEIERGQKDLEFNGIDIFKTYSKIEVQSGEENEENIIINLPKVTSTTLGNFMPIGQKAYNKCYIDGAHIGVPQVNSDLSESTESTLDDQIVTIKNAADVRHIHINANVGNNTVDGLLAEIEDLNMDGVRETSAVTYGNFVGFGKSELHGTEGDMVRFTVNIGGTAEPSNPYSFLIGRDEDETQRNFIATLDRIVRDFNTHNNNLDISRDGSILRSSTGKTISMGEFEFIDNPGSRIGNFSNTPVNNSAPPYIPNSEESFQIDGIEVRFTHSGNPSTDMTRAYNAARSALIANNLYYDAESYANNISYPYPHDREHYYTLREDTATNSIVVTKINLNSTEATTSNANLLHISEWKNYQTHVNVQNFTNYSGEIITLNIEGNDVNFLAAGTINQTQNASNLASAIHSANIPGIDAHSVSGRTIITRTNSENPINILYNDENNNANFTNFNGPEGDNISFQIDGTPISFTIGATQNDSSNNLYSALTGLSGYTVTQSGPSVKITKNNNQEIALTNYFATSSTLRINSGPGSSGSALLTPSGPINATIQDQRTEIQAAAGPGSVNTAPSIIYKESGMIIGTC